ncbi:Uncharacterized protein APZ42_019921 [Daphnia magna]|uniref:Protein kinase domain-containing protein n=1 Tax=Daphnia magna TaxID=35525 RepID=A0A162CDQ9_9CRUS|nr:Uncharacterized protein APZ42_019921 [Daphnia magna]
MIIATTISVPMFPNQFFRYYLQLMEINARFRTTFGRNGTYMSSTMTLINVTHQDTGYYRFFYGHVEVKQYIYVFVDNRNLVIINDMSRYPDYNLYFFHQGELGVHIPCKPTHPNVSVSLIHVDQLNKEPNYEDVLADPHSSWSLEPELGLTLKKVMISNTGNYRCVGTMDNITDEKHFTISVKGIELTRMGDPDDPPEGSNVTLICRTLFAEIKFPSPPEWAYEMKNTGRMKIINELSPPEGIQIKTHDYSKQRNTGGFTLNYYESRLDLFEVNQNTYTTFQCKANKDKDAVTKIISFQVKAKTNNQPVSNFVLFEKTIETTTLVTLSLTLAACLVLGLGIGVKLYLEKRQQVFPGVKKLLAGNVKEINRQLPIEEQTELLPYDKQWEFPRYRLKLGLISFNIYLRPCMIPMGIKGSEDTIKTVAVKMIRSHTNMAAMEALVSEMKILIYLGSHLNVVSLLGACTKQMSKGELFIIVEYCRFGNLQNYLSKHRNSFINLVDGFGNMKSVPDTKEIPYVSEHQTERDNPCDELPSDRRPASERPEEPPVASANRYQPPTQPLYQNQPPALNYVLGRYISTCDLISWSFQIARGMEYLVSKQVRVLHGDLAARNVLLADDGVVKLADFGMAKKMYYEGNYERKEGLMPVKWMAIESLTDRIFSSESDVRMKQMTLNFSCKKTKQSFKGMDAGHQLIKEIQKGYRMEKPEYAPNLFGEIMTNCWKSDPKERPTFSQLREIISQHMTDLTYGE